jgi:hypothetical protein
LSTARARSIPRIGNAEEQRAARHNQWRQTQIRWNQRYHPCPPRWHRLRLRLSSKWTGQSTKQWSNCIGRINLTDTRCMWIGSRNRCTHPMPLNGLPPKLLSCFNHRPLAITDDGVRTMWISAERASWSDGGSTVYAAPKTLISCENTDFKMKAYIIGRIRNSPSRNPPGGVAYVVYQVTPVRRSLVLHVNYKFLAYNKALEFTVFEPG